MAFTNQQLQEIICEKDAQIKELNMQIRDLMGKLERKDQEVLQKAQMMVYQDWKNKNGQFLNIFLDEYVRTH